jgi:uncharacterized integral membrane protein
MADRARPPQGGKGSNWKPILAISAGILLLWFVIANAQEVQVTWWVVNTSTSLIVVILVSALLGAGVTYFLTRVRSHGSSRGSRGSGDRPR